MLEDLKLLAIHTHYDEDVDDSVTYIFTSENLVEDINEFLKNEGWPTLEDCFDASCEDVEEKIGVYPLDEFKPVLTYEISQDLDYFQFGFVDPDHLEWGVFTPNFVNIILDKSKFYKKEDIPFDDYYVVPITFYELINAEVIVKLGLNTIQAGSVMYAIASLIDFDKNEFIVTDFDFIQNVSKNIENPDRLVNSVRGVDRLSYNNEEALDAIAESEGECKCTEVVCADFLDADEDK